MVLTLVPACLSCERCCSVHAATLAGQTTPTSTAMTSTSTGPAYPIRGYDQTCSATSTDAAYAIIGDYCCQVLLLPRLQLQQLQLLPSVLLLLLPRRRRRLLLPTTPTTSTTTPAAPTPAPSAITISAMQYCRKTTLVLAPPPPAL